MNQTQGRRRGISTVIAGTIIILLIIVGVIPLLMLYLSTAQTMMSTYNVRVTYQEQKELERAEANVSNNVLTIANTGSIPIDISYLILSNSKGICSAVLNLYDYINTTVPSPIIEEVNTTEISTQKVVRIDPGGYIKLNITSLTQEGISDVCSIVTARGNIIEVEKEVTIAERARTIIATPITLDVATLANRTDITVNQMQIQPATPDSPGRGMTRVAPDGSTRTALIRFFVAKSAGIQTLKIIGIDDNGGCNVSFNNIYVGYSPDWSKNRIGSPKYNILLTGYEPIRIKIPKQGAIIKIYGESSYIDNYIINETDYYIIELSYSEYIPYRIKIINYIPNSSNLVLYYDRDHDGNLNKLLNKDALGFWWLYADQAIDTSDEVIKVPKGFLELNGTASEVIIYLDACVLGYNIDESSYDAYILPVDVDGNGYPEFLFVTEDESCSSGGIETLFSERTNDVGHKKVYSWHLFKYVADVIDNTWADDWSIEKFFINLTGYSVDGRDISFIQVAIRVYFHDNLYDNPSLIGALGLPLTKEITDPKPIFGLYVVNAATGEIVGSREWTYDELDVLENTYQPSTSFSVLTATLPIPQNGTYFLAIGFQDPYPSADADDGYNDGDFVIAIEVAGMTLYARP